MSSFESKDHYFELVINELSRTFYDRLINKIDREFFILTVLTAFKENLNHEVTRDSILDIKFCKYLSAENQYLKVSEEANTAFLHDIMI